MSPRFPLVAPHPTPLDEAMQAPYDAGYASCSCFWGRHPGSLVAQLTTILPSWHGLSVLDLGCGDGKSAAFAAQRGANVRAIDISALALRNAHAAWRNIPNITWERADVRHLQVKPNAHDVVLAYGLLHCLASESQVRRAVHRIQCATAPRGFNVICAFNARSQDLTAHPHFDPVLLSHGVYVGLYANWQLLHSTDRDLNEVHPHNGIRHTHSMTRLLARKP